MEELIQLTIDGVSVEVPAGTTVLEAAKKAGINIPTLCYLKDVNQIGACRLCVVDTGARSLQAACVLSFLPSVGLIFLSDLLGVANTALWGNLVQDELLKSRDLPFAAALSAVLLLLTAVVIVLYRRAGGHGEDMVF